jgi:hypothetical protein
LSKDGLMNRVEAVLREHALALIPDPTGALRNMPLGDLMRELARRRARMVSAVPRRVHTSSEFEADRNATRAKPELDGLVAKIEAGESLDPHLGTQVWLPYDPAAASAPPSARTDRDLLLADWGIYHLHLAPEHRPDLLFVAFKPEDAYLIGLYRDTDWVRRSALETVIRNWPDAGIVLKTGATSLVSDAVDGDREHREAGISGPMIEYDGAVWAAASLGMTLDGMPLQVAQAVMMLMWALDDWRAHVEDWLDDAAVAVNEALGEQVEGEWAPAIYDGDVGIVRAGCFHPIARLP